MKLVEAEIEANHQNSRKIPSEEKKIPAKRQSGKCQRLQYHTQEPKYLETTQSGVITRICVRATVTICATGLLVGFCFLIVGGSGFHHSGSLQVLMYIGLVMVFVNIILLLVLCTSYDVFNVIPIFRHRSLYQFHESQDDIKLQKYSVLEKAYCPFPNYGNEQSNKCIKQPPISVHNDVINANVKSVQECKVKNCICLLKKPEYRIQNKTTHINNNENIEIPFYVTPVVDCNCSNCIENYQLSSQPNSYNVNSF